MTRVHIVSPQEDAPTGTPYALEGSANDTPGRSKGLTSVLKSASISLTSLARNSRSSRISEESSDPDAGIRRSTTAQLANAVEHFRHSADNKAKVQLAIEGEHEEMVSRLKIRLSSAMRVVADDDAEAVKPEVRSVHHDASASYGGTTRLQRIRSTGSGAGGCRAVISGAALEFVYWFAGHPSMRNNQSCVIYHGSSFRRLLDIAVAFAALSTSVLVPLDLGFDVSADYSGLRLIDEINTMLFIVDLFASFLTTYPNMRKDCIVSSHRAISSRYLTTWFPIDLIAALPLDEMIGGDSNSSSGSNASFVAKLFKMPRLLRAFRLMRLASNMPFKGELLSLIGIAQMIAVVVMLGHWIGCSPPTLLPYTFKVAAADHYIGC